RPRLAADLYLHHHTRRILELEHWYSKHFPVRVARVRIVGVLDGACPALVERVLNLRTDLIVGQVGEKRKRTLSHAHGGSSDGCGGGWHEIRRIGGRVVES